MPDPTKLPRPPVPCEKLERKSSDSINALLLFFIVVVCILLFIIGVVCSQMDSSSWRDNIYTSRSSVRQKELDQAFERGVKVGYARGWEDHEKSMKEGLMSNDNKS